MRDPDLVAVIIVTHRSGHRLPGLLAGLERWAADAEVVVVDSGSPEGPPAVPAPHRLIALEENVGFGRASNVGAAAVPHAGWLVFLNPDVRLGGPTITQLRSRLRERARVGIATAPMVDGQGRRIASAWGPTSPVRGFVAGTGWELRPLRQFVGRLGVLGAMTSTTTTVSDDVAVAGHVLGGAMIVRGECWDDTDGFDPGFFLYWEDADLCTRARRQGWEVCVLPATPLVHDEGTSSEGVSSDQRWAWYVQGAERYAERHLDPPARRRLLRALRWGARLGRRYRR